MMNVFGEQQADSGHRLCSCSNVSFNNKDRCDAGAHCPTKCLGDLPKAYKHA